MRCQVLKTFNRRGERQLPGSIIEVPEGVLQKLAGYVQPVAIADSYKPKDGIPKFKAWLEDGQLRTTGVCDDLAAVIRNLTGDDMALQAKLLKLHVEKYSGPHWLAEIRKWRERGAYLFEHGGIALHPANWQAASEMNLLAFAEELKLKQPDTGEGA